MPNSEYRHRIAEGVRPSLGLERPGLVWLHRRPVAVERRPGSRSVARLAGGRLLVDGPAAKAPGAIDRWYRREARQRLLAAIAREAPRLGVRPARVSVRDPRTRWGSCSSRGTLSFSWRLLLVPEQTMEYVVVHELCHLRELNHSPRFWALLDEALPGWQTDAVWLRDHAREVGSYRPRLSA